MSGQVQWDDWIPLQGGWRVRSVIRPSDQHRREEAWLNEEGIVLFIEGNRITHRGATVATLADKLYSLFSPEEIHRSHGGPFAFVRPDGKPVLCSYRFFGVGQVLGITYPPDACPRSGHGVYLDRHQSDRIAAEPPAAP